MTDDMAPAPTSSKTADLPLRAASAVVMLAVTAAVLWLGETVFLAFLCLLAVGISWEWGRLSGDENPVGWLIIAASSLAVLVHQGLGGTPQEAILIGAVGAAASALRHRRGNRVLAILMGFGAIYAAVALLSAYWLRMQPDGLLLFVWLLASVVATDTGAYAFGRAIGGPKLAPVISPKKTWAGLIGAMICAGAVGAGFALWQERDPLLLMAVGAGVAVIAQAGDLLESWMKRRVGLKDSSGLIPGHGGILDRLDGFLAATPVVALAVIAGLVS